MQIGAKKCVSKGKKMKVVFSASGRVLLGAPSSILGKAQVQTEGIIRLQHSTKRRVRGVKQDIYEQAGNGRN